MKYFSQLFYTTQPWDHPQPRT